MPPRSEWRWRGLVGLAVGLWFFGIYGICDWITGLRAGPFPSARIALDDAVPFIPQAAWVYMTVTPLIALPLLVIHNRRRVVALAWTQGATIALAGLCFLLVPLAPSETPKTALPPIMAFADWVNLTYNSAPSLHVALSVNAALAMIAGGGVFRQWIVGLWGSAVVLSTLLTHQHTVIDVASGLALAAFCYAVVMPRLLARAHS